MTEDDIDNSLFGLNGNDDFIDSFYVNDDDKIIHISQFKSTYSLESMASAKKEWFLYLIDIPK